VIIACVAKLSTRSRKHDDDGQRAEQDDDDPQFDRQGGVDDRLQAHPVGLEQVVVGLHDPRLDDLLAFGRRFESEDRLLRFFDPLQGVARQLALRVQGPFLIDQVLGVGDQRSLGLRLERLRIAAQIMVEHGNGGRLAADVGRRLTHVFPYRHRRQAGGDGIDADQGRQQAGDRAVVETPVQARRPHPRRRQREAGERNEDRQADDDDGEDRRRQFVEPGHTQLSLQSRVQLTPSHAQPARRFSRRR
jgi:hypothetical protein